MNTKQKLRQIHLNEWAARFSDQKSSGLTVKQWCEQNNFTIHTYNYWKHALKEEVASQVLPDIVPVSLSEIQAQTLSLPASNSCLANRPIRATAKLTIGDISVEFDSDISEEFLRTILKAVRYA